LDKLDLKNTVGIDIRRIKEFWQVFHKNKLGVVSLIILGCYLSIALFAPYLSTSKPYESVYPRFVLPSSKHFFGTDDLGRDVYSQVIYGTRVSLMVGFTAALISIFFGVFIGGIAGYFGGIIDDFLMRITDSFLVVPKLVLGMVLISFFSANIWLIIVTIAITVWPEVARIFRAEILSLKEQEFVSAAKAIGKSDLRILFTEILPNAISPVIVITTFQVGSSILMESSLSFLGLGDPNVISWGYMISMGRRFIATAWWMVFFPGLMIFILVFALNVVGDGLNEIINPKLRRKGV
jgi:peptide/nickel transport system permease protein